MASLSGSFLQAYAGFIASTVKVNASPEPSLDVQTRIEQLKRLAELHLAKQQEECEKGDSYHIDWFEASLSGHQRENPFLTGYINKYRLTETHIDQAQKMSETLAKCKKVALSALLDQAKVAEELITLRQMKPQQIKAEVETLTTAYFSTMTHLRGQESLQEHFDVTTTALLQRIKQDNGKDFSINVTTILIQFWAASSLILEECQRGFRAQTWAAYSAFKELNEKWAEVPDEIAAFATIYNRLAKQCSLPSLSALENYEPLLIPHKEVPNAPVDHNSVNWKALAIGIKRGDSRLLEGIVPMFKDLNQKMDGLDALLSSGGETRLNLSKLHKMIRYRIDVMNGFENPADGREKEQWQVVKRIGDLYDANTQLTKQSTEDSRAYLSELQVLNRFFFFAPQEFKIAANLIENVGFVLHPEGSQAFLQDLQTHYDRYKTLSDTTVAIWAPDNTLTKQIRRDFDRLCWGLLGWKIPEWGSFIDYIDPREIFFQFYRSVSSSSSYSKGEKGDLPLDPLDVIPGP